MVEIEKPRIECIENPGDNSYGKYVVEPLERGYGTTLGNSLRRILLSSLPGTAAVSYTHLRAPIAIPAGVEIKIEENNVVTVKGPKGTLTRQFHPNMTIAQEGAELKVTRPNDAKENRALHGLTRTLLHNMVVGVTEGCLLYTSRCV